MAEHSCFLGQIGMEDIFRCAAHAHHRTSETFRIEDRMYNVEVGTDLLDGNVDQVASHADILEEVDPELCSKLPTPSGGANLGLVTDIVGEGAVLTPAK
jgi:hypothetical protein